MPCCGRLQLTCAHEGRNAHWATVARCAVLWQACRAKTARGGRESFLACVFRRALSAVVAKGGLRVGDNTHSSRNWAKEGNVRAFIYKKVSGCYRALRARRARVARLTWAGVGWLLARPGATGRV